jgi:hypothetical protein
VIFTGLIICHVFAEAKGLCTKSMITTWLQSSADWVHTLVCNVCTALLQKSGLLNMAWYNTINGTEQKYIKARYSSEVSSRLHKGYLPVAHIYMPTYLILLFYLFLWRSYYLKTDTGTEFVKHYLKRNTRTELSHPTVGDFR